MNKTVNKVTVDSGNAKVTVTMTDKSQRTADAVIVTVPLGILKEGSITFDPALTTAQQDAINRTG